MTDENSDYNVFVNCPFDSEYSPLLEALCFCICYFGLTPRLASERIEAGENRLDKIIGIISGSRYSVHDLSRCRARESDEFFRMNMPFEFGLDFGFRRSPGGAYERKKFLVFEEKQYDLKQALSDLAGTDVAFHERKYEKIIQHARNFFRVEAGIKVPGVKRIIGDYVTFQTWLMEKKISEGHSEEEARQLPVSERLEEIRIWMASGSPAEFDPERES